MRLAVLFCLVWGGRLDSVIVCLTFCRVFCEV